MVITHVDRKAYIHGYELGAEPTPEMFAIYRTVQKFLDAEEVANWLDEGDLSQGEFELLCRRFGKLDWSGERWEAIGYEYREIIDERS